MENDNRRISHGLLDGNTHPESMPMALENPFDDDDDDDEDDGANFLYANENDDDEDDAGSENANDQDSTMKCPVCNTYHDDISHHKTCPTSQRCSHGSTMIYVPTKCPICMEDKSGPPTVALSCGHVLCTTCFKKIDGRIGEGANETLPTSSSMRTRSDRFRFDMPPLTSNQQPRNNVNHETNSASPDDDLPPLVSQNVALVNIGGDSSDADDDLPDLLSRQNNNTSTGSAIGFPGIPETLYFQSNANSSNVNPINYDDSNSDSIDDIPSLLNRNAGNDDSCYSSSDGSLPQLIVRKDDSSTSSSEYSEISARRQRQQQRQQQKQQQSNALVDTGNDSDSSHGSMPALLERANVDDDSSSSEDSMPAVASSRRSNRRRTTTTNSNRNQTIDGVSTSSINVGQQKRRRKSSNHNNSLANNTGAGSRSNMNQNRQTEQQRRHQREVEEQEKRQLEEQERRRKEEEVEKKKRSMEKVQKSISSHYHRRKAAKKKKTRLLLIYKLQSLIRRFAVRKKYNETLEQRINDSKQFRCVWGKILVSISKYKLDCPDSKFTTEGTWSGIKKKRFDMMRSLDFLDVDSGNLATANGTHDSNDGQQKQSATVKKLDSAVKSALLVREEDDEEDRLSDGSIENENEAVYEKKQGHDNKNSEKKICAATNEISISVQPQECDHIRLTKEVLKWLNRQDTKYSNFFLRRIKQLADGQRSRILQKNLTGCKTAIYETYLDQKSGQRILWTQYIEDDVVGLLIWYVAKHDSVSRYIKLIDDAECRLLRSKGIHSSNNLDSKHQSKKLVSASTLFEGKNDDDDKNNIDYDDVDIMKIDNGNRVFVDPLGDTPLKLHTVNRDELTKLSRKGWKPPLHLTAEERVAVEKEGTVLLIGRSGTGKTICICNRIDYDRRCFENITSTKKSIKGIDSKDGDDLRAKIFKSSGFSQLFVARSSRICNYVREIVDGDEVSNFTIYITFEKLLRMCDTKLSLNSSVVFPKDRKIDYQRFKNEVYKSEDGLDVLIIWTQIRSFIKGSIEAVHSNNSLTLDAYLTFGANRCRLNDCQRRLAYKAYERYEEYCKQNNFFDDCDTIMVLLKKIIELPSTLSINDAFEIRNSLTFTKIYVDEVQDYTQAEITLFFLLCKSGTNGLFLAGDNAQSVVEGVEFRFQEVRSVCHHLVANHYYTGKNGGTSGGSSAFIPDKPLTINMNFRSHSGILDMAASVLKRMFAIFPNSANKLKPDVGMFLGPRPGIFHNISIEKLQELVSRIDGAVLITHDGAHQNALQKKLNNAIVLGVRESKGLEFQNVIIVDFFKNLPSMHQKPWKDILTIRTGSNNNDSNDFNQKQIFPELEAHLKLLYTAITRCSKRLFIAETSHSIAGSAFVKWSTFAPQQQETGGMPLAVKQDLHDVEKMIRTPDEWKSTGVDYAMTAESSDDYNISIVWLQRAIHCFERGDNKMNNSNDNKKNSSNELLRKAKIHLASSKQCIQIQKKRYSNRKKQRNKNQNDDSDDDDDSDGLKQIETDTAKILEDLISENLLKEVRRVLDLFIPLLSRQQPHQRLQSSLLASSNHYNLYVKQKFEQIIMPTLSSIDDK